MNLSTQSWETQNHPHSLPKRNFFLTDEMKKEVWWIQTYSDYQKNYPNNNYTEKWYLSLDRIEQSLWWNDPIEYLVYLFSKDWEWLSIIDTYEEVKKYLHINELTSFYNFINKLLWNKRSNKNATKHTREKLRKSRINSQAYKAQKDLKEKTILDVIAILDWTKKESKKFDKKVFFWLKNTVEKTMYVLDILWYINSELFLETIKNLVKSNSLPLIQLAIQQILDETPSYIPEIRFNKWRVSEIINQYYD